MYYVQRDAKAGGYEYAVGPRIEDGDVVVERWVTQERAARLSRDEGQRVAFDEAAAGRWAEMLGCGLTCFGAPKVEAPKVDHDEARRRRVAKHLPREERIARGFASAEEIAAAEVDERRDRIRDEVEADEKRDAERVERAKKAGAAREAAAAKRAERKAEREAQVITAADVGAVPAEPLEDTQ